MKLLPLPRKSGFTLLETVIAIGVLAVLLTAFMYVFGPAMAGIRKSINVQEADRLASTLERELGTLRTGQQTADIKTGFDKAFQWVKQSNDPNNALFVYQYRGNPSKLRSDNSLEPVDRTGTGAIAGKDYIVQPMVRRLSDPLFVKDIAAVEGSVFVIKCTQLVFDKANGMIAGSAGEIRDPQEGTPVAAPDDFKEAVVAFSAEFYSVPGNSEAFLMGESFKKRFRSSAKPIFTRNLAVRR
jgi:prepilin-type N-terminal cleavage/methylation domain-containing protein